MAEETDDPAPRLLGSTRYLTGDEVAEQAGMPRAEADALWQALGFPHLGDDVAFADGDVRALRQAKALMDANVVGPELRLAQARILGRTMAALAESQVMLAEEAAQRGVVTDPFELLDTMETLQTYIWRRHLLAATERIASRPVEGTVAIAVGFTDLVSYTARSREMSTEGLAKLLDEFEARAQAVVVDGRGRIVKTLGDEIMWVADDPVDAAEIALGLADEEVRTGVAFGPTLERAGDHYGPTVNLAARLTGLARPGTVLIDREMDDCLAGEDRFRRKHLRPASVRGYDHLRATVLSRRS
ncbi:MAG TPA: adenylate/guanylate cyclase domain-containing protein [Mycobacteriales bacterium]